MDQYLKSWDIYQNKSKFKFLIYIFALIIGAASIWYTQVLVNKLAERERKLIDLYAKGLKNAVESPNDGNLTFLFREVIEANNSIPVILTDENHIPLSEKNVRIPENLNDKEREIFLKEEIEIMKEERPPIVVELAPGLRNYIYYRNSFVLNQLLYYPFIQLTVIGIFALITYLAFSYSRNAEQNRVWVGLAKETAHQLGTPITSLMAWLELLKEDPKFADDPYLPEMAKDIDRLNMITSRFSNIGSAPSLKEENLNEVIQYILDYLKVRISGKVKMSLTSSGQVTAKLNRPLFEWVIENICKNAVDAMSGTGNINISISYQANKVHIDISDTGKGIPRSKFKDVFRPGFTTKKRGWGLGLTLVKRIVENYHGGKIFVLSSEIGKGTTFRIVLSH
jgi:two-component system, sporulation sensor kinase E